MNCETIENCFLDIIPTDLSNEDRQKIGDLLIPVPRLEAERIGTLRSTQLLDSPAESIYDRYTNLCARVFRTPISLISLVDVDRQWFKSRVGMDTRQTHRNSAFCAYTVHESSNDVFIVRDAAQDPRFSDSPLVTGYPHIRFYAGAALIVRGQKIGSLCIVDTKPRADFDGAQAACLREIAMVIEHLFEERRQRHMQTESDLAKMTVSVLYTLRYPLLALNAQKELLLTLVRKLMLDAGNQHVYDGSEFVKQLAVFRQFVCQLEAAIQANLQLALAFTNPTGAADMSKYKHTLLYVQEQNSMLNKQNLTSYSKQLQKMRSYFAVHSLRMVEVIGKLQHGVGEFGASVSNRISWSFPSTAESGMAYTSLHTTYLLNIHVLTLVLNFVLIQNIFKHPNYSAKITCSVVDDQDAALTPTNVITAITASEHVCQFVLTITFHVLADPAHSHTHADRESVCNRIETCSYSVLNHIIKSAEGQYSRLTFGANGEGRNGYANGYDDEHVVNKIDSNDQYTTLVYTTFLPCIAFIPDSCQLPTGPQVERLSSASTCATTLYNDGYVNPPHAVRSDTDEWLFEQASGVDDDDGVFQPARRRRSNVKNVARRYWQSLFRDAQQRVVPI
ncbi:GAF domain-containing protein [archaeon]|nr:MAG: GAF domain-containing protein [archaeon]